jgi:formylglycine-generating enzyme required for sulfatase activity
MSDETIFAAALELPSAERAAYLAKACGSDIGLRKRLEGLLTAHDRAGGFMARPAVAAAEPPEACTELGDEPSFPNDETVSRAGNDKAFDDEVPLGFLSPGQRSDSLGRIGHYEVLQVLGKGGFGIVFRAFDDVLQRVVAIKVMAPQLAATSPARKRFLREARTSAQVRHENVVQVYEVAEQPLPYLAMEFIPGETLQQRLDRTGPLDVPEVLRIGRQIAEGLAAAHANDLIHRDIKPSNVLIEGGPQQRVKITDFGLARAADDASISQSGIIAGTPMYMAPEQALGRTLDQRADLFSLGSVLYQMVAGRPPFRANSTLAVMKRVAEDTPRDIREIIPETPQWLCDIIAKLHAKNPGERYQSAREVADVLADCEQQLKTHGALRDIARIPAGRPAARRRRHSGVMVVVLLLVGILGLGVIGLGAVAAALWLLAPIKNDGQPVVHSAHSPDAKTPPPAAAPFADAGWVQLFNGKDLTGWELGRPGNGRNVWGVEDGSIVGSGLAGHLYTQRNGFANFHLRLEMKVNEANHANTSGLWFRVPAGQSGDYPDGYWIEAGNDLMDSQPMVGSLSRRSGSDFQMLQSNNARLVAPDTWYTLEVIADGPNLQVKVNGKLTSVVKDGGHSTGRIALYALSPGLGPNTPSVVYFRKIEIKDLPPTTFKNNIGMEFVLVPKGKSWLGGGSGVVGEHGVEAVHEVEIAQDFYLGKYEVTQEEWQKVMGRNPSSFFRSGAGKDSVKDIADADLARFPVDNVSWDDCQEFIARVNERSKENGWVYRLPKQSEWEYACRGGPLADRSDSTFDFYGEKPTNQLRADQANIVGKGRTCKVGSYKPNKLGLYDMHGNVWEWCEDIYDPKDAKDPVLATLRAIRGGCWVDDSGNCRAAVRHATAPSLRSHYFGLRVARVPSGAPVPEAKTPPP